MSSQISRKMQAMSIQTGTPICNHGMVSVYHPQQKWSDRGIFYMLEQPRAHNHGMSNAYKGMAITGLVMDGLGGLLDAISNFFTPKKAAPPAKEPVKEEPVKEEPVKEEPVQEEPVQEEPVPDDNEGDTDLYGIDGKETNVTKVNVIKYGGPYHYAQLYTYEDGNPIPKGSADFKALYRALAGGDNGIQEAGNQRVLKNEITLPSGKTVKIMSDPNARIAQGFDDAKKGTTNKRYEVYQETNGEFYIYNKATNEKVYTATTRDACVAYAQKQGYTIDENSA